MQREKSIPIIAACTGCLCLMTFSVDSEFRRLRGGGGRPNDNADDAAGVDMVGRGRSASASASATTGQGGASP